MTAFQNHENREAVCEAIKDELKELAVQRCHGGLSEEDFIAAVLDIEAREVRPMGLTLTASHTRDRWTVFSLKIDGANDPCASFEFLPQTGEFRRGCSACES